MRELVVFAGELLGTCHPDLERVEIPRVVVIVGFQAERHRLHARILPFAGQPEHGVGLEQHLRVLLVAVAPAVVGDERRVESVGGGLCSGGQYRCDQNCQG